MRLRPRHAKQEETCIGWIIKRKMSKVYKIPVGLPLKEDGVKEGYFESRLNGCSDLNDVSAFAYRYY